MYQHFYLFLFYYCTFEYFYHSNTFFIDFFSFACLITWQTCLKKYVKNISLEILTVVSFISSFSSFSVFFIVSSSFRSFILFILSISIFYINFSYLFITISRFSIPLGFDIFVYVEKKIEKIFFLIYISCGFRSHQLSLNYATNINREKKHHLPEIKKAQVIYTGIKLGSEFNIKDVTKKNTIIISFAVLNIL